jgi:hypothetical protein
VVASDVALAPEQVQELLLPREEAAVLWYTGTRSGGTWEETRRPRMGLMAGAAASDGIPHARSPPLTDQQSTSATRVAASPLTVAQALPKPLAEFLEGMM